MADLQGALARALGEPDAVAREEPFTLDEVAVPLRLRPRDGEELGAVLRAVCEAGGAVLVRGSGQRLGVGNPLRRADAVLETSRLAGVLELDADEGVAQARAGTPLASLADAAREAGWELPLDVSGPDATLGGALASAAQGAGHARARDLVLGLGVVLASGARTKIGGRVVKNVTGYDLAKLHTGGFGGLGVIESAWVRLRPLPESRERLAAPLSLDDAGAAELALAAARRPTACASAWCEGASLWVELAGDEAAVASDAAWLRERAGATPAQSRSAAAALGELRVRIAARPTRSPGAARALRAAGASVTLHLRHGLVHGAWHDPADADLAACAAAAAASDGPLRIEAAPLAVRRERDVFGESPGAVRIVRALKQRFDPNGLLNPGRLPGGL